MNSKWYETIGIRMSESLRRPFNFVFAMSRVLGGRLPCGPSNERKEGGLRPSDGIMSVITSSEA